MPAQFYNESAYVLPGSDVYHAISFLNVVQPEVSLSRQFAGLNVLSLLRLVHPFGKPLLRYVLLSDIQGETDGDKTRQEETNIFAG